MKKVVFLLESGLLLMGISLFSQTYLINTDYLIIENNSYLIINGNVNNQSSGNFYLTGTNSNVIVQNDITNDGNINSSGIIDLYGDWINNSAYSHNSTSYVKLKGANQNIGGSVSTTFYNLYLEGTGVKTLGNNQNVDGTLNLNDRELATQNYTMTVNNPLVASVQRTTGFVSSTVGGGLARATNSTSAYLYPVGVSGKYRPAELTPSSSSSSIYKVRMADGDATNEGYNRSNKASDICEVNPSFFHIMHQTNGSENNANVKVYFDNSSDGNWSKVGYWNNNIWNNYIGSSTNSGSPLYYGETDSAINLTTSLPIALTIGAPIINLTATNNIICNGDSTTLYAEGANSFIWSNNLGANPSVIVTPSSNTTYSVTGINGPDCSSTASISITVNPSPNVSIYKQDESCIDAEDGMVWIVFNDNPLMDYDIYINSNPVLNDTIYNLAPGEYTLNVIYENNCSKTFNFILNPGTEDCYITHIYVPNVFSPDNIGNADNEYLKVYGKGIKTIDFGIFDRWGNEVFHTQDISVGWDGTYKGQPALAGDYTYILVVNFLNGKRETLSGHILLIR